MRLEQFGAKGDAAQTGLGFFDFCQANDVQGFFDGMILQCRRSLLVNSLTAQLRSLLHELETRLSDCPRICHRWPFPREMRGTRRERLRAGSNLQPEHREVMPKSAKVRITGHQGSRVFDGQGRSKAIPQWATAIQEI